MRPGDKVRLTFKRDGKEREVTVVLQEDQNAAKEKKEDDTAVKSGAALFNKLGAGFVPVDDAQKKQLGISSGVVVTQVHDGGLFDFYGVRRGLVITEINGRPVNNADDIEKALEKSQRGMIHIVAVPQKGSRAEYNLPLNF